MLAKNFAFTSLFLLSISAIAADSILPQKMEGRWGQRQNSVEISLIKMEAPTKAILDVVFWDGCTRRGETTAEFKEGTWEFVAPGGFKCDDITVKITQLEGKNRFEGTTATARGNGTIYLEWK